LDRLHALVIDSSRLHLEKSSAVKHFSEVRQMKLQCAFLVMLFFVSQTAAVSAAFVDISRPGDPIVLVNGLNQGDTNSGPPPSAEAEANAINDTGQKYLNFLDLNSGFAVTPSANPGNDPVIGLRLYTANDAETRDPASYQLAGSNASITGPWEVIASGNLALPAGRNPGGAAVSIPPEGNTGAFYQEIMFANTTPYSHYQIVFPTLKDAAAANSMQIAEVEFLVVPEPAGLLLALAALLGLGLVRPRR
jgi:hypothetical protein